MASIRRLFSLVATLVLLSSSLSIAENGEILFRNMPWLQDVNSYVDQLRQETLEHEYDRLYRILQPDLFYVSSSASYHSCNQPDAFSYIDFDSNDYVYQFFINGFPDGFAVAEYPIHIIEGFAISGLQDGEPSDDPGLSRVVYAEYGFDCDNIGDLDSAAQDLRSKLISLYGRPYHDRSTISGLSVSWLGENQTYVALIYSNKSTYKELIVAYGKTNIQQLADELVSYANGAVDGL